MEVHGVFLYILSDSITCESVFAILRAVKCETVRKPTIPYKFHDF